MPETPRRRPGLFVVALDSVMIGIVTLDRRDAERRGHLRPETGEAELGYLFLPEAWGRGYAAEACAAALKWFRLSRSSRARRLGAAWAGHEPFRR